MLQALLCLVFAIGPEVECNPGPKNGSLTAEEVSGVLAKWEAASRETKTAKLKFTRTIYNLVFQTETRGEGELFCRMPNDVRITVRPAHIPPKPPAGRMNRNGRPFRCEPDLAEQWIWTANQRIVTHDSEKSYIRNQAESHELPLPKISGIDADYCSKLFEHEQSVGGASLFRLVFSQVGHPDFHVPFLLSIQADKLQSLWSFEARHPNDKNLVLIATPTAPLLKQYYSECRIMIDTNTWQTKAIKIIDPEHNLETVYVIDDRKSNLELPADTFSPDLKSLGYKDCSPEDMPAKSSPVN